MIYEERRKKIREGLVRIVATGRPEDCDFRVTDAILSYLTGQGVVIKSNVGSPFLLSLNGEASMEEKAAYLLGVKDASEKFAKRGFAATAPLGETE